jgi:hypothetical protein
MEGGKAVREIIIGQAWSKACPYLFRRELGPQRAPQCELLTARFDLCELAVPEHGTITLSLSLHLLLLAQLLKKGLCGLLVDGVSCVKEPGRVGGREGGREGTYQQALLSSSVHERGAVAGDSSRSREGGRKGGWRRTS